MTLITERGFGQVKRGSLWIFANEFVTKMRDLTPGAWGDFDAKSGYVGYGYVNPHSLIAGRILSREPVLNRKKLFTQLIKDAFAKRENRRGTGSYRLIFSESDNLPGLICDLYEQLESTSEGDLHRSPILVAQSTTAGMDEAMNDWSQALIEVIKPKALVIRADSSIRHLEGLKNFTKVITEASDGDGGDERSENDLGVRAGIVVERETILNEGSTSVDETLFAANFLEGQKTGFFLDQRDNRLLLKKMAQGKTVLDLCCYSGGWGLSALKGQASKVTFVDQSSEALKLVTQGIKLNEFDEAKAELIESDVFEYLEQERAVFDIVVCDPPAFVKSKKNLPQAIKAYLKLNSLAIRKLSKNGILFTSSCSFHLSEEEFLKLITEAFQKEQMTGQLIYRGTQSLDHPWILNRPESHYLKCFAIQVV